MRKHITSNTYLRPFTVSCDLACIVACMQHWSAEVLQVSTLLIAKLPMDQRARETGKKAKNLRAKGCIVRTVIHTLWLLASNDISPFFMPHNYLNDLLLYNNYLIISDKIFNIF